MKYIIYLYNRYLINIVLLNYLIYYCLIYTFYINIKIKRTCSWEGGGMGHYRQWWVDVYCTNVRNFETVNSIIKV